MYVHIEKHIDVHVGTENVYIMNKYVHPAREICMHTYNKKTEQTFSLSNQHFLLATTMFCGHIELIVSSANHAFAM